MALMGSVLLMVVIGFGISMDVEDLKFAVLDRDQSHLSNDYVLNLSGSRYFVEQPPIRNYDELDQRMRDGDIALAIEIPPGFARDVDRGRAVQLGVWLDGAMPMRAETVQGYVKGMHLNWLEQQARKAGQLDQTRAAANIEVRFRYNPDVKSLVAMVPAVIPLLLMLIPAMLATLSVVREKEFGSIINFYVTPASSLEFLAGKQLPYVALGMLSFVLLFCLAYFAFGIPFKGSFPALVLGAFLYIGAATALGLLISSFMRSQTAAVFGTAILTLLPAVSYSGNAFGDSGGKSMVDGVGCATGSRLCFGGDCARYIGGALVWVVSIILFWRSLAQSVLFRGAGLETVWPSLLALLVLGGLFFSIALVRLRRSLR